MAISLTANENKIKYHFTPSLLGRVGVGKENFSRFFGFPDYLKWQKAALANCKCGFESHIGSKRAPANWRSKFLKQ